MLFLLLFVASGLFTGCGENKPAAQVLFGEALGTTYQVKFFSDKQFDPEKGIDSIFSVINASMSTYHPDSDISRINRGDTTIRIDENFARVFEYSDKIYRETSGYFDPTVGNLVNAYGFGPDKGLDEINPRELDSMLQFVGFDKLRLNANGTIAKERQEVYLDFNSIAKGYAVDVIGEYLVQNKIENFLIEIGGELVAKGRNIEKEQPWIVAIDDPMQTAGRRDFQAKMVLEDRGMATSGNYRKFRLDPESGQHFVHTIDPVTGFAIKSDLLSVSVLAENCALADGYATAFMAMGFERSKEILSEIEDIDVYFIYAEDGGQVNLFTTPGFRMALIED